MLNITIYHYLITSIVLFVIGLAGSVLCRNVIKILISIEFMLTAVNLSFIAFSAFGENIGDGFVIALFYVGIGAVELALALYIFYLMYTKKKSDDIQQYGDL